MIDPAVVNEFLAQRRIAVVGASRAPRAFGNVVYRDLKAHGYDTVASIPDMMRSATTRATPTWPRCPASSTV